MANQAIALQARAPQGNFLAPAIQQGAQFINMMTQQRAAERQAAAQQQQMQLQLAGEERAKAGEARAAELHPSAVSKAQADAMTAEQKATIGFYDLTIEGLKRASTPQQAIVVADYLKQKFPGAAPAVDQTMSTLPSDPGQFEPWRKQTMFQSMTAQQQLAKKFIEQNTGTGTRQLEVSEFEPGAAAQELPGSRIDTGQKITYVKGPNGEVIPMPERTAAGGGLVGGNRGGAPLGPQIEQAAQQLSPGVVVSGRARTPKRNAEVDGVPNSFHMSDNARDFQPAKGQTVAALAARLQPLKAQGYDVLAEGDHVHVEPGPRMGRAAAPAGGGGVQFGQVVPGTGGGKVDPQKVIKATTAAEAASVRYDRTIDAAEKLLKSPALDSIVGNFQGNIPETVLGMSSQGAANALALLNTLIARGGFAELQAMRDASPTGGALGQVSDRENTMLQNAAATLIRSQDEASFRENLKAYIAELRNSKERVQSAWSQQFGQPFPGAKPAAPPRANAPSAPPAAPAAGTRRTPVPKNSGWGKAEVVGD
jgi:hypothetical protein